MKAKLTSLCFLLVTTLSFGQNFEGKIIYDSQYKSKIPAMSDDQFAAMLGTKQEYYIKDGDYRSETNGTFLLWQIYINKDNKLYNKMSNSDAILWNDGSVNPDEVTKVEVNKNVTEILGRKCDELIFTCKSGVQKYYFNRDLKVDAKAFEGHKFGNWSEYIMRASSLPLKIIIESPQFSLTSIATEVQPMKLDSKLFQLPAGSKTEKSPY
jgi:hypothetical protein